MNAPADDLAVIARAVRIHNATEFEIGGELCKVPQGTSKDEDALEPVLREALYNFYCHQPSAWLRSPHDPLASRRFIAKLSEANGGTGTWEPGWRLGAKDEDGRFEATKDGLVIWVWPDQIRTQITPTNLDSLVRIHVPKELCAMSPGFYVALGNAPPPDSPPKVLTRLYWHLTVDCAERALALVTSTLNDLGVPFRFKVVAHPQAFTRADAGVLYLDLEAFLANWSMLCRLHQTIKPYLRPEVPRFVKPLAPGLGVAEDPANGESFGQHRCRIVAAALWSAWKLDRQTEAERIEAAKLAFLNEGLDPDRPYLASGSSDLYGSCGSELGHTTQSSFPLEHIIHPSIEQPPNAISSQLIDTASTIGLMLCREACWSGQRCTWVGRALREADSGGVPTVSPIGIDLYGGAAGVALFLSELWAFTEAKDLRTTALGALQYVLAEAKLLPRHHLGLYSGLTGIGLTLVRAGALLGEASLMADGAALIRRACSGAKDDVLLDLMGGIAGAILALLAVGTANVADDVELAVRLAEQLYAAGQREGDDLTWHPTRASGSDVGPRPLTGLSHGAAGMGLALLEVGARSGRTDLRLAGEAAFRYENKNYSTEHKNWFDLRTAATPSNFRERPSFSIAWCHGAPGIGLARLRAMQLFARQAQWLTDAHAALHTTRTVLSRLLDDRTCDPTPCHGLAGLFELLLTASDMLQNSELAAEVLAGWRVLIELHQEKVTSWPSGFPSGGKSPGLMLGLAGVGHALLRAARPESVRSVLLVRADGASCWSEGST